MTERMRKIQIVGGGCPKCQELAERAEAAAKALGLEYEIEKVTDPVSIAEFGLVMTPALAVDGEVKIAGRVPSVDELKALVE